MTHRDQVAARLTEELADFVYPLRDWMVDTAGCDADVAILGSGRRAMLASYALRRERIGRQLLVRDHTADSVEMYGALSEPTMGLPHLDMTSSEFWCPEASFRSFLMGWKEGTCVVPVGPALLRAWGDYLGWLKNLFAVPEAGAISSGLASLAIDPTKVRLEFKDGSIKIVRRLVLAGPSADVLDMTEPPFGLASKLRVEQGQRLLVIGGELAVYDRAITALVEGAQSVMHVAGEPRGAGEPVARRLVRHPFHELPQVERVRRSLEAASLGSSVPPDWARQLQAFGPRYKRLPLQNDGSLPELLIQRGFNPDRVVVPDPKPSLHAACEVSVENGARCRLDQLLRHFGVDEHYRLRSKQGAPLPIVVYGTAAGPSAGPRAYGPFLARYGIIDILETISRDLFVEDEGALFASFSSFRTSETFGGKLMEAQQ